MAKQLRLTGTMPERQSDLDDAAEQLRVALAEADRATGAVRKAKAVLLHRMLEAKSARYEYATQDGIAVLVSVDLAEPNVKLKIFDHGGDE